MEVNRVTHQHVTAKDAKKLIGKTVYAIVDAEP